MNSAERYIFNSHQRVLRDGESAKEWFKKRNLVLFAKIQIALDDERDEMLKNTEPSEFVVKVFDGAAKAYLECVEPDSMESHDRYMAILGANHLTLMKAAFGVPIAMPMVFSGNSEIEKKLDERHRFWKKEAYKRLIPDGASETNGATARPGYRSEMDEWMERSGIPNLDVAARELGIGIDTLKSIRSNKGDIRYSDETLQYFLTKTGIARK